MTVEAPLGTAERLVEEQRGVCAMCQEPLDIRRRGWGGFAR